MTVIERTHPQGELSDAELISSVRGGDVSAYGDLFARHRDAATRLARQLVSTSDADDLVSEAFAKVLNVLLAGGGPDVAFRAYLLTAVRRLHVDKIRATNRAMPTDDLTPYDQGEPFNDTVIAGFEGGAAARAYASLPERWQLVLWHLEVEGQKPAEVAPLLGMTPNSVSALAYRAREGLRQAYLQMHSADISDAECRWTHDKLGAYVRKGLSRRDAAKVEEHLKTCRKCTALFVELSEVNSSMAGVIGPLVLGTATMGYLGSAGGTSALGGVLGGFAAAFGRAREIVLAQGRVAVGIGAAAGVAGIATVAVLATNSGSDPGSVIADPRPVVTNPSVPAPTSAPVAPDPTPSATPTRQPQTGGSEPVVVPVRPPSSTPRPPLSSPSPSETVKPSNPSSPASPSTPTTPPVTPTTPVEPITPSMADVSVRLAFQPKLGLLGASNAGTLGNLTAEAFGIPEGTTGTIKVQVFGGTLSQIGDGCAPEGNVAVCAIGPDTDPLVFKVNGLPVTASATVTGPTDVGDPVSRNNRDSMLLGLL
ncbi:MAG: sigma-70 region 2 domain protein [Marmoricola sp.]|nr:sigma-70 region 2 domain protein [Marmoricola sp.]